MLTQTFQNVFNPAEVIFQHYLSWMAVHLFTPVMVPTVSHGDLQAPGQGPWSVFCCNLTIQYNPWDLVSVRKKKLVLDLSEDRSQYSCRGSALCFSLDFQSHWLHVNPNRLWLYSEDRDLALPSHLYWCFRFWGGIPKGGRQNISERLLYAQDTYFHFHCIM